MKSVFLIISLLISSLVFSQKVDTIEVSYNKTVVLIFESTVISDDIGSPDVLVQKEREMLKLAGAIQDFNETTLFVETEAGYYSFILKYNENPKKLSIYLPSSKVTYEKGGSIVKQVSDIKTDTKKDEPKKEKKPLTLDKENAFYNDCQIVAQGKGSINDLGVLSTKVSFMLTDIYIKNDHLYFKVLIKNNSNIDYDIELLRFVIKGKKGAIKQAAVQETELEPVYIFNGNINEVKGKDGLIKVFCFKKFTYADDKRLFVEIWENGGERILSFPVTTDRILNVKRL